MAKPALQNGRLEQLGNFAPEAALSLISMTSDVAFVIDAEGVVRQVACGGDKTSLQLAQTWTGKPWIDTVTGDTRQKVEALLREAATSGTSGPREIHHPTDSGSDIPVSYSAIRLGEKGQVLVVGRDLRAVAAIQQQLIETQQVMERDYWQMRQAETRYRLLFQIATDAVMVVDAQSLRVLDANRAAGRLFVMTPEKIVGKPAVFGVDPVSQATLEELLASARVTGSSSEVKVRLSASNTEARVSATPFRSEGVTLLLMRISAVVQGEPPAENGHLLSGLFANTSDALVITDHEGLVISANSAFLDLAQVANDTSARGRSLDQWLGRPGSDLSLILAITRKNGAARHVSTLMRGEHGENAEVELSAASFEDNGSTFIGFVIRSVERRLQAPESGVGGLAGAVEQLSSKLGKVTLPDLVQDTTDLIERHFIAAALTLSENNRTTAAEILGLSRQSLYVKLRRHRLDGSKKIED